MELRQDRVGDTRDRYGRSLRYVYLAGEDFNARLIRDGYAHAIRRFSYTETQRYITLEDRARGARTQLVEPPLIRVCAGGNVHFGKEPFAPFAEE